MQVAVCSEKENLPQGNIKYKVPWTRKDNFVHTEAKESNPYVTTNQLGLSINPDIL
jgi:hypothetical protein